MVLFLENLLKICLEAAPWLLFGLVAAAVIKVLLPEGIVARWLGGRGLWSVTKAALIGAPLPLCSCGVLPAALAVRRGGASRGSTLSFLIATPETGVDSVALSYVLLGPVMMVVRPIAAVITAVVTGLLALFLPDAERTRLEPNQPEITESCGSDCTSGCESEVEVKDSETALSPYLRATFDIWDDIVFWLAIGMVLAALVETLVPPLALAQWGSGLAAMGMMLLIGIPIYICATASTPVAAGLLLTGISPGTVLVFLLAGPATNIATLMVVGRELGRATAAIYLLGIAICSVSLGLLLDALLGWQQIDVVAQLAASGELVPLWLAALSLLLLLFAIRPLRRLFNRVLPP